MPTPPVTVLVPASNSFTPSASMVMVETDTVPSDARVNEATTDLAEL
jgi:hypothetical protein